MKPNKRFYGRRRTRSLRQKEKDLMKTFLPEIEIVPSSDGTFLDLSTYFGKSTQQFCLEVGFGKGEHLLWQAQNNEDVGFIGAEPFLNGVASLLSKIKEKNINNIRIFPDTVSQILHSLPSQSINKVFVLFPDPWPKKRHHKRRLIQPSFALQLSQALKVGGIIHLATDWQSYAAQILEVMSNTIGLANVNSENDLSAPYNVRSETKFEHRGLKLGHDVFDYLFKRV